jgi:hypothetical protein
MLRGKDRIFAGGRTGYIEFAISLENDDNKINIRAAPSSLRPRGTALNGRRSWDQS